MATSLIADKSDAEVTSDERASIVSSAKMHLSIFQAQALYLHETGALPKEISEMMRRMYDRFGDSFVANISPEPESSVVVLNPPQNFRIGADYVPGNQQEVLVRNDDHVIAYAWLRSYSEAAVYNPRNKTAGRIPRWLLGTSSPEKSNQGELYMAKADELGVSLGHVPWKAGDYIRVWGRVDNSDLSCTGFCFHIASGQIGKFSTSKDCLEPME